jgi:hypothetical protein
MCRLVERISPIDSMRQSSRTHDLARKAVEDAVCLVKSHPALRPLGMGIYNDFALILEGTHWNDDESMNSAAQKLWHLSKDSMICASGEVKRSTGVSLAIPPPMNCLSRRE